MSEDSTEASIEIKKGKTCLFLVKELHEYPELDIATGKLVPTLGHGSFYLARYLEEKSKTLSASSTPKALKALKQLLECTDRRSRDIKEVIFGIKDDGDMDPICMRTTPEISAWSNRRNLPTGGFTSLPVGHSLEEQFKNDNVHTIELFTITHYRLDKCKSSRSKSCKSTRSESCKSTIFNLGREQLCEYLGLGSGKKGGKRSYKNKSKKAQNKSKKRFFSMTY
jgi:hypothetical protein